MDHLFEEHLCANCTLLSHPPLPMNAMRGKAIAQPLILCEGPFCDGIELNTTSNNCQQHANYLSQWGMIHGITRGPSTIGNMSANFIDIDAIATPSL
jgi:hypothetical protein